MHFFAREKADERYLHYRFAGQRVHGEWFSHTDELGDLILFVLENGRIPPLADVSLTTESPSIVIDISRKAKPLTIAFATRKALGLTQAELAAKLGVDHSTVSRIESGDIPLTLRTQLAMEALVTRAAQGKAA